MNGIRCIYPMLEGTLYAKPARCCRERVAHVKSDGSRALCASFPEVMIPNIKERRAKTICRGRWRGAPFDCVGRTGASVRMEQANHRWFCSETDSRGHSTEAYM